MLGAFIGMVGIAVGSAVTEKVLESFGKYEIAEKVDKVSKGVLGVGTIGVIGKLLYEVSKLGL